MKKRFSLPPINQVQSFKGTLNLNKDFGAGYFCDVIVEDVVKFQKGKWDCSDAGMVLYWITGANVNGGIKQGTVDDVKSLLLDYLIKNPK